MINSKLVNEINKLKNKKKRGLTPANMNQIGEIQDIADFVGDSLG